MKLLLDTHILLWFLDNNPKLPEIWKRSIEDRHNSIAVSMASLWELTINLKTAVREFGSRSC